MKIVSVEYFTTGITEIGTETLTTSWENNSILTRIVTTFHYVDHCPNSKTPFTLWNLPPRQCCAKINNSPLRLKEMIEALKDWKHDCHFLIQGLQFTLGTLEKANEKKETNTLKIIKLTKNANDREQDFRNDLKQLLEKHKAKLIIKHPYITVQIPSMFDNSSDTLFESCEFKI